MIESQAVEIKDSRTTPRGADISKDSWETFLQVLGKMTAPGLGFRVGSFFLPPPGEAISDGGYPGTAASSVALSGGPDR